MLSRLLSAARRQYCPASAWGKDGASQPPLTAQASRDDIIMANMANMANMVNMANDGGFVGLVKNY